MKAGRNGNATGRERLLDAAEMLFADKGFDAASMRAITRLAGVELGLANYHFGTKADLFRQVHLRRAPEMASALEQALDSALAGGTTEAVFAAFARTHLDKLHADGDGWRHYMRLAAATSLRGDIEQLTEGVHSIYAPVFARYRAALEACAPACAGEAIEQAFHVFHRALLSIVVEPLQHPSMIESHVASLVGIFGKAV